MPILIVDDDDIDAEALIRAFKKQQLENPVFIARDGLEALEMLEGNGRDSPVQQPCLVILDLNMPRMNGHEFLEAVSLRKRLHANVILVLSTSAREEDKARAYAHRAAGYFLKENLPQLTELIGHYCRINEWPVPSRT
jgi:CheY-like chemotaxis protein